MVGSKNYSNELSKEIDYVVEDKNSKSIHKDLTKDYIDSIFKRFTETEKGIINILYHSDSAITKNKIRNYFIYSYLKNLIEFWDETKGKNPFTRHLSQKGLALNEIARDFKRKHENLPIDYPSEINTNFGVVDKIIQEVFCFNIKVKREGEFLKKRNEKNELVIKQPETYKRAHEIVDETYEKLSKETETQFLFRVYKILSKYNQTIPSKNTIEPTLEFFKEMGWVNYRIQNKNKIWFLTPKMNIFLKKTNEIYNLNSKESNEVHKYESGKTQQPSNVLENKNK